MVFDLFGSLRSMLGREQPRILRPLVEPRESFGHSGSWEAPKREDPLLKIKELSRKAEEEYPQKLEKFLGMGMGRSAEAEPRPSEPAPKPEPIQVPNDKKQYSDLVTQYFPKGIGGEAIRIGMGESGLNPNAISPPNDDQWGSRDWGLFQINDHWQEGRVRKMFNVPDDWSKEEVMRLMLDPVKNILTALEIWEEQGWDPWSTAEGLGLTDRAKGIKR